MKSQSNQGVFWFVSDSLFIEDAFAIVDDRKNFHVMWTPIEGVKTLSSIIFWCEHAFGDICKVSFKEKITSV